MSDSSGRFVLEFSSGGDVWMMRCPACGHVFFDGETIWNTGFAMDSLNRVVYRHRCEESK